MTKVGVVAGFRERCVTKVGVAAGFREVCDKGGCGGRSRVQEGV